jgi:hypothetical protein
VPQPGFFAGSIFAGVALRTSRERWAPVMPDSRSDGLQETATNPQSATSEWPGMLCLSDCCICRLGSGADVTDPRVYLSVIISRDLKQIDGPQRS